MICVMAEQRVARERDITRAQAVEYLKRVDPAMQRRMNVHVARRYARDMDAGYWIPGVAVVAFDRKGRLINGQHVLNALILSKRQTLRVIVSLNHEAGAFAGFDKNRKRSASDDLRVQGVDHAGLIASAATVLWQWENNEFSGEAYRTGHPDRPTAAQVCELVKAHPGIDQHLYKNPFRGKGLSLAGLRAASYILHGIDEKRAKVFFHSLIEGVGLPTPEHPIAVLRKRFIQMGEFEHLRSGETLACIFKAWNAYVRGEDLSSPLLRKGEPFPELA